jgi:hypothetical protein
MLRTAIGLTLVTAASLAAQSSQPQPSPADSAAISAAPRALLSIPDRTGYPADRIHVEGDTAWVRVWLTLTKGQRVLVVRRKAQWQAIKSDTNTVIIRRSALLAKP